VKIFYRIPSALFILIATLCGLFWSNTSALCSSARPLDLPSLTSEAEVIADVTVQNTVSYWSAPAGVKSIHTRVNFTVNKIVKGTPPPTLSLEFLGGEVGNKVLKVPGVPQFVVGERYLIFSSGPDKAMVSPILGLDQGAMRIVHDDKNNVDRVYRHWGQPVSAQENFKLRMPVVKGAGTQTYLRSADTVDRFIERIRQSSN
jgi:hypothetical protein